MSKKSAILLCFLVIGFMPIFMPLSVPMTMHGVKDSVSTIEMDFDTSARSGGLETVPDLNELDSSGGDYGWSPVYRLRNGQWRWDQQWGSAYRHDDEYAVTPYGEGTQLIADRQSTADTAPQGFYQYRQLSVSGSGSYTLHLDFYLKEDSSTTASSVDNWEIMILSGKHSSWQQPLFWNRFPNCDEHGSYQEQIINVLLEDHSIYLLIGHWDSWYADWDQGHTKYFNEITASERMAPPWDAPYIWSLGDVAHDPETGEQWVYSSSIAGGISRYTSFVKWINIGYIGQRSLYFVWDFNVDFIMNIQFGAAYVQLYWFYDVYDENGYWLWGDPFGKIDIYHEERAAWLHAIYPFTESGSDDYSTSIYKVENNYKVRICLYWVCTTDAAAGIGFSSIYGPSGSPCNEKAYANVWDFRVYLL